MLEGLRAGALVPPEIQEDRYFQYRVPELLLSYVDYGARPAEKPLLPYEREPFEEYFPRGRFLMRKTPGTYLVVNLAKGGVVKQFDLENRRLVFNDCGLLAQLENGRLVTSQWIGTDYAVERRDGMLAVGGDGRRVPTKIFNPFTFIVFRVFVLLFGWNTWLAYHIKGLIRCLLMTRAEAAPLRFRRQIEYQHDELIVTDTIELNKEAKLSVC